MKKSKTSKTVRIISPHSADESTGSFGQPLTSPPPDASGFPEYLGDDDDSTVSPGADAGNPFSNDAGPGPRQAATEEEQRPREIQRPAARPLRSSMKQSSTVMPSQLSIGGSQEITSQRGGAQTGSDTIKQQYDVDRFTKLLLPGREESTPTVAAAPPPVSFQVSSNAGDSSSNTDASSISRQSLFDSIFEARHETPKSSHEASPLEEAGVVLPARPSARSGSSRPPVPRARHGKPLDDAQSSMTFHNSTHAFDEPLSSPPTEIDDPNPSPRTPTDLNKPLPTPPRFQKTTSFNAEDRRISTASRIQDRTTDVPSSEPSSPLRPQAAPPPPPTRRHSQRRPRSLLGNPNQPKTINEDHQSVSSISVERRSTSDSVQENASSMKPPPPPPRWTRSTRSDSKSSISSARSILSISERLTVSNDALGSSPVKSPPPLPPSRHPGSGSSKRASRPSGGNPNPAIAPPPPPPPPPPRMRGSSQSSTNSSVLSGDYRSSLSATDRRNSGSSSTLQGSDHAPDRRPSDDEDVMADLAALQREVDELRGKLGQ